MLKSVLQLDLTCEITICKISFNFINWNCSKQKFLPKKDQAVRLLNSSVFCHNICSIYQDIAIAIPFTLYILLL